MYSTECGKAVSRNRNDPSRSKAIESPGWLLAAIGMVLLFSAGCVQRRLMIRSQPPGAMVYVDDYKLGPTPVTATFTYYGTRKIRLVKDGYQTLTVYERIDPPWYQIPPIDFFAENVLQREIRDTRVLEYQLQPQPIAPTQQLLDRADMLRREAGSLPPLPAASPLRGSFSPGSIPQPLPTDGSDTSGVIIEPPRTSP
ncbi:MAG: PEGA domain-containing protein [Thermogutta sp.]